ncbi:MAG: cation-translocating P-type ATPase [Sulfuriferula sp.]
MANNTQQTSSWHTFSVEDTAHRLAVDAELGLTAAEASSRLHRHGPNMLPEARRRPAWRIFFDQFADFMILVLLAAAIITGVIGDPEDTIAIAVIILLNAIIGFTQEYRAEKAMAALKKLAAATTRVRRDGQISEISSAELVAGDIVLLEAGNLVPADLRLLEAAQLKMMEAALTGESQAAEKTAKPLAGSELPLSDRHNMAYKGTVVSYGRGAGIVVATGLTTELGKIATLLASEEEVKTPLQKRLARFGSRLAIAVLAICLIIFVAGILRGEAAVLMFLTAVSLAVAAIPEALPAVVTISLALGAYRLVKQHALIRRLPAVETLGSITIICSDKTGTLTQNHMHAEAFYADGVHQPPQGESLAPWANLYRALALCNDAHYSTAGHASGDPTEVALLEAAAHAGVNKVDLERLYPRVAELPFDSERKLMTTLNQDGDAVIAYCKGAPESLLPRCTQHLTGSGEVAMQPAMLLTIADTMASEGLRVLAVAFRRFDIHPEILDDVEQELVFLGFIGLMDPPRREARQAVAECKSAGITPIMITGDHPATARAIAKRLAIIEDDAVVMTGVELTALSDTAFAEKVKGVRVYARVDPAQKIRIVKALQAQGEFVAMTGDGVNDAPALRRADIGVAMGRGGTDVAREAAHMVLLDDNFATIIHAIREGRRIFDNIRKFIKYTMTSNSGEIWVIFLAPFLGLPIPLLPIHILWINLVTDGLPGLALAKEPAEHGVMQRPPRPPAESIFAHGMWQHILWVGFLMGGTTLLTQAWAYHTGSAHWQSMVFTVLTLSQLGHVLAVRSERASLFSIGLFSNSLLLAAVTLTFLLQMATLYIPLLNHIFKTQPLSFTELLLCLLLSTIVFWGVELEKLATRRGWLYRPTLPQSPPSGAT